MDAKQAAALREKFPPEAIGRLPKGGTSLDYVGHAAVTDRLLKVDPEWTWEPMAVADDGGPMIRYGEKEAELWVRLTVCGMTRLGVGTAPLGSFELAKQLVSDAIRNAAMRFGVALDLWSKEDLVGPVFTVAAAKRQLVAILTETYDGDTEAARTAAADLWADGPLADAGRDVEVSDLDWATLARAAEAHLRGDADV